MHYKRWMDSKGLWLFFILLPPAMSQASAGEEGPPLPCTSAADQIVANLCVQPFLSPEESTSSLALDRCPSLSSAEEPTSVEIARRLPPPTIFPQAAEVAYYVTYCCLCIAAFVVWLRVGKAV